MPVSRSSFPVALAAVLVGVAAAQTAPPPAIPANLQPSKEIITTTQLAQLLLELQPTQPGQQAGKLEIIAPTMPSSLSSSFEALVFGWCEHPAFLTCNPAHYPIAVTVLTGKTTLEPWRSIATWRYLQLPGALSGNAASVYALDKPPPTSVWLAWGRDGAQYVITGGALEGAGETATVVKAPGLATALHAQLFVSELVKQSRRWTP
jgi:hypothetical protein